MRKETFIEELLTFLGESPTPYHACSQMARRLESAGFEALEEGAGWQLEVGGKYYVVRNGSSLVAFIHGRNDVTEGGLRLFGAHTDSPCLKVKPSPDLSRHGFEQLGVEVYGGVLLNPWFDRDLSLAGRVTYETPDGAISNVLIDFERPVALLPSLAIHLDKGVNENRSINKQKHLPLVLNLSQSGAAPFRELLKEELGKQCPELPIAKVLDYEISCYDTQRPAVVGRNEEFIASARLDNLLSCFIGLRALLDCDGDVSAVLVCNDHEEVGSNSAAGAQGPMLRSVLERMLGDAEAYARAIDRSMLISADNAHGIHPNYADRHDGNHGPVINQGPVIKVNANQRYATNSLTSGLFRKLCELEKVPVQAFTVRSDMGCGSTIGPITATEIGVQTIDVGVPQLAMHSIRETAGSDDSLALYKVARRFFNLPNLAEPLG